MNRFTVAIAVALALVTGLVLSQIGLLALQPEPVESLPSTRALTIAQSFYNEVNNVLATGDQSIDTAVASAFVEHLPDGQADRTLPDMIDQLLDLRSTWPRLRLTVVELEQQGLMVAARLKIEPGEPAPIPGLPLQAVSAGELLEFLQIENGGVIARWASGTPVATVDLHTRFPWDDSSLGLPAIQQIALDPGNSVQIPLDASIALLGAAGMVMLDRDGVDPLGISHSAREPLQQGEVRILQGAKDRFLTIGNASGDPAVLWAISTGRRAVGAPSPAESTPEAGHPTLVTFLPVAKPPSSTGGTMRISITRLVLPPGAAVPVRELGAIEEVAVLDGAIEVTVGDGRALKCSGGAAQPFDETETIAAGEGISARESTSLGYRVTGLRSATILIVRLEFASE